MGLVNVDVSIYECYCPGAAFIEILSPNDSVGVVGLTNGVDVQYN